MDIMTVFWCIAVLLITVVLLIVGMWMVTFTTNLLAPRLQFPARVVAKRQHVSSRSASSTDTDYFVTFEFGDHTRRELAVNGTQYGSLAGGDAGILHIKGQWFLWFDQQCRSSSGQ